MATTKIVLRKKKNKDGTYPLAIRVTKDRKSSYIHLGHNVNIKDWDAVSGKVRKTYPNSQRLNNLLLKKLQEAEEKSLELETSEKDLSAGVIKKTIKRKSVATFNQQAKEYLDNLRRAGKYNRLSAEEPRVNRFKEFLNNQDVTFPEITVPLLNRFKAYLKATRTISDRTVVNHLIVIRSIFNQAIKGNLVDQKHYPFGTNKIVIKFPDSIKIGLTPEEIKKMEDLVLIDPQVHHARNIWLFSFYLAGMRVSDVLRLRWSDIHDNRLYYAMGKNNKVDSLKMPEKAMNIVNQYLAAKDETELVFPDLKSLADLSDNYVVEMRIKTKVAVINGNLSKIKTSLGITKPLTMHIPRHSFGNISGDKIPIQMLQKLYRHTSVTTTIGYQANFIHKDVDEALASVIGG